MREFGPVDETMRLAARLMAALLVGGALAQEGEIDCKRMKAKELRQMLAARGVKCEGCAEKVPSPVLPAAPHSAAAPPLPASPPPYATVAVIATATAFASTSHLHHQRHEDH